MAIKRVKPWLTAAGGGVLSRQYAATREEFRGGEWRKSQNELSKIFFVPGGFESIESSDAILRRESGGARNSLVMAQSESPPLPGRGL
jgi:hypothetical protein